MVFLCAVVAAMVTRMVNKEGFSGGGRGDGGGGGGGGGDDDKERKGEKRRGCTHTHSLNGLNIWWHL